jgi:hypothetical protein
MELSNKKWIISNTPGNNSIQKTCLKVTVILRKMGEGGKV